MKAFSFDTETHQFCDGMLTPKPVCGSFYWVDETSRGNVEVAGLYTPKDSIELLYEKLSQGWLVAGANIAYDFGVVLAELEGNNFYEPMRDAIWSAYKERRVWDVLIAEALYALGQGHFMRDPVNGLSFDRYSLDLVTKLVLKRDNAKENDEWRVRYAELEHLPFEQWPDTARQYPIDDARNQYEVFVAQALRGADNTIATNVQDIPAQCEAAWALHLGAIWGFRVDQSAVNELERKIEAVRTSQIARLTDKEFYRPNGVKNTRMVKRAVILSYAPDAPTCAECQGVGQIQKPDRIGAKGNVLKPTFGTCQNCQGTGYDYTKPGLNVPTTEKDGISCNRDTLYESGDEDLLALALYGETEKSISTYIPFLRNAEDNPLTLKPNSLLETGRASYGGVIQQFPRKGGERECIVPRAGNVFYSVDYEGLELATHAQSCLWILDYSSLANALNAGQKPHDMLAAKLYGKTDDEFAALMAAGDVKAGALRQAAKPANFGFPGGMGAITLVQNQRQQGPDTTAPDGHVYHGLRFCILMGLAEKCGVEKITEYRGEPISPLCKQCVRAANVLRDAWFRQWPENKDYFQFINTRMSGDTRYQFITQHVSGRIRANITFTAAANTFFQGLAADGAKRALCSVVRAQYTQPESVLFGSRNILFAHDELIGEICEEVAGPGVDEISRLMVEAMRTVCPDVVIKAEPTLMRRWYKAAKLVRDANGVVIPWEPKK